MRTRLVVFLLLYLLPGLAAWASDGTILIVTGNDSRIENLSRDEAEQLYLGRLSALRDGTSVRLLDLPTSPTRDRFYLALISKNSTQTRAYWSRMVFSGRARPPREVRDLDELRSLLETDPNLIAYIPAAALTPAVRILLSLP